VGVTTTLANCLAKPLFSADAAMRPMTLQSRIEVTGGFFY
jgi:hypothetical protein